MDGYRKWKDAALRRESNPNVFYGAEMGWEAALEWIDGQLYQGQFITDIIKDELKSQDRKKTSQQHWH